MDEKSAIRRRDQPDHDQPHHHHQQMLTPRHFRTRNAVVFLLAVALWFYSIYDYAVSGHGRFSLRMGGGPDATRTGRPPQQGGGQKTGGSSSASASGIPVPLEAHIMSKCPDAKDCLHDLILPVMQRAYDKTNFTLSFIGRQVSDGGVECKHGPAECMGNIIELCAAELYPDPKIYLGFTMCLFREYQLIPERSLVEDCALEHGVDIEAINECATRDDGEYGTSLLRQSVQHSADAGVQYSCTVRLNEQTYCVRDDGEWKDCPAGAGVNDLVLAIEKLYQQRL